MLITPSRLSRCACLFVVFLFHLSFCFCFVSLLCERNGVGRISRSLDGGLTFTAFVQSGADLFAIAQPNALSAVAVGSNGTIIAAVVIANASATPAQTVWTDPSAPFVYANVVPSTSTSFASVIFVDGARGIAVGASGTAYITDDSGASWYATSTGSIRDLTALALVSATGTVVAVGAVGTALISFNGGANWTGAFSDDAIDLYDVAACDTIVVAVGSGGAVVVSRDGGNFTRTANAAGTALNLFAVECTDAMTVFVSGARGFLAVSLDGAATFTAVTVDVIPPAPRLTAITHVADVMIVAARDAVLQSANGPNALTRTALTSLNAISGVVAIAAAVLTVTPSVVNISVFTGTAVAFTVNISNTGTAAAVVYSFDVSGLALTVNTTALPLALPIGAVAAIVGVYDISGLASGVYYSVVTVNADTPQQRYDIAIGLILTAPPTPTSFNWLATYWYVPAAAGIVLAAILYVLVRRRIRYVKLFNRRVRYVEDQISFWGAWCCSVDNEDDSDDDWTHSSASKSNWTATSESESDDSADNNIREHRTRESVAKHRHAHKHDAGAAAAATIDAPQTRVRKGWTE